LTLVVIAACTTSSGAGATDRSVTPSTTATSPTGASTTEAERRPTTPEILDSLDGRPCPDSEFTCVTVEMPLDHSTPGDGRTIDVTFAVLPAAGESQGAFVTATGGPGSSGIAVADSYTSALDPAISGSYDVVFFDQRGMAMSGGLTCPDAAAAYYRTDIVTGLGLDEEALATAAATFAADCVAEMDSPEELPYLGTDQVAADLDGFREMLGFEELVLYGESYGTQVAQTYAAAYGDHLTRMILDGTVDLTLDGFTFFEQQAEAFGGSLQMTLDYCTADPLCADDMGDDPDVAYDRLMALLVEEPLTGNFPLPDGGVEERQFGLGDLEVVASAQMYSEDDRMMFLRALAAYTERGDLVPLLRLLYLDLGIDPLDEAVLEDPTWSDGIYYAVECLDYAYPGTTPEERAAAFFAAGAGVEVDRLGTIFYGDLPCAYWPSAASQAPRPDPLVAAGIPTVVLGATADPATPYGQGVDVEARLDEGYLITKEGGPHVIFGRGNPCPDDSVTAFILSGASPEEAECEGEVVGYYIPLLPASLDAFDSAETMLDSIEFEILYMPEYYWWDTETDTSVGCNLGGTITFSAAIDGDLFTMEDCAFMEGVTFTGEGSYNWDEDVFTLDVQNGSVDCTYVYRRAGEDYDVEDNCPADPFPD
jgi:pimeloyl-ACP methyl ester carboxylesterase